jgi:uncharacterized membrane protein
MNNYLPLYLTIVISVGVLLFHRRSGSWRSFIIVALAVLSVQVSLSVVPLQLVHWVVTALACALLIWHPTHWLQSRVNKRVND